MAGFINYYENIMTFLEEDIEVYDDEFDNAVTDITKTGTFNCTMCCKSYKTKGGLTRHTLKHREPVDEKFTFNDLECTINNAVSTLSKDMCLTEERRESFSSFVYKEEEMGAFHKEIEVLYANLASSNNAEDFYACYFGTCVRNAAKYFKDLPLTSSTMLATKIGENVFTHFQKKSKGTSSLSSSNPTPIADREIGALQYLAGYVVKNLLKKARGSSNCDSAQNLAVRSILENSIADDSDKPLIHLLNRGGLTAVSDDCFRIFFRAEEKFRTVTEVDYLRKIDVKTMAADLMKDVDVVSFFNAMVDSTDTTIVDEIKQNLLDSMLKLYLRVRSFSLARDITANKSSEQAMQKALRKNLKKSIEN